MKIQKIDEDSFLCTKPDLNIITFDKIFKSVVFHGINIIYNIYGDLNKMSSMNPDIQRIFINTILEQVYKRLSKEINSNTVLYIDTKFISEHSDLWFYINRQQFETFFIKTCKHIIQVAPIPIYFEKTYIDFTDGSGETEEVIRKIEASLQRFRSKNTSLNRLKRYSTNNGLIHFMSKHHPEDDIKNSIFFHKYFKGVTQ